MQPLLIRSKGERTLASLRAVAWRVMKRKSPHVRLNGPARPGLLVVLRRFPCSEWQTSASYQDNVIRRRAVPSPRTIRGISDPAFIFKESG